MTNKDLFHSERHVLNFNGHDVVVFVNCYTTPDLDWNIDDIEPEEPFRSDTLQDLESGLVDIVGIIVEVDSSETIPGAMGHDSLWGCIVGSHKDAMDIVKDNLMIENALQSFRASIPAQLALAENRVSILKKYA